MRQTSFWKPILDVWMKDDHHFTKTGSGQTYVGKGKKSGGKKVVCFAQGDSTRHRGHGLAALAKQR